MTLSIESDGTIIPDTVKVVSIVTTHAMNQIPHSIITILDGDMPNGCFPVSDQGNFTPGTKVVIRAGYDATTETIFNGVVIKHTIKIDGENNARLIIDCRNKALAMTVARKNVHYINQTDQQIIATLVDNTPGLSATVGSTGIEHKELVQYYTTDWDYMMARGDANGFVVTVDAGIVSVKPPLATGSPVLTLRYGIDLIEFEATLDAQSQLDSVTATSWDSAQMATIQTRHGRRR